MPNYSPLDLRKTEKLKLGILLDSFEIPAWAYNSLERIMISDYAVFCLIILNDRNDVYESKPDNFWKNKHKIIYDICNFVDEKMDRRKPNAFKLQDLRKILPHVPTLMVKPVQERCADYFQPFDIQKIKEAALDILIKMGFRNLRGEVLAASKYGIWAYHHGDDRINRGGPPGFWEVLENWPETGSSLHILNGNENIGKILCRSAYFTHPLSPARNRSYYFWASSSLLPRQVELFHHLGKNNFFKEVEKLNQEADFYDRRQYETPSNMLALKLYAKIFGRVIYRIFQKAFYLDQWFLLFDLNKDASTPFSKFKKVLPPKDRFWADPHVIRENDHFYIFIEEYAYKNGKGHISVIEMDGDGNLKDPVRVLEKDYHLSYPFVFEYDGKYFMVPESQQNRTIDLYECIEFPWKWKFRMNLMENINAVDTTLFKLHGKWWLFTAMAENEGSFPQVELFLFFSNELFTREWKPHPLNPIISDVKRARPAGGILALNDKIFRPSQDCSKIYGHGFDLNEVLVLSENEYLEKRMASVRPNWDKRIEGTHTFSRGGELTIIDAFMRKRRFF